MSESTETQQSATEQDDRATEQDDRATGQEDRPDHENRAGHEDGADDQNERATDKDETQDQLVQHLRDVHALEEQSIRQLERAAELADDELQSLYKDHLEQSREHEQLIKERIEAHDLEPSAVADLTMRSGAIGLRQLADVAPDTPVKLAMHFYAFEHLEIAAYEFLARIARDSDDSDTVEVAERILEQEREAAEKVAETFDRSAELCLQGQKPES